MSETRTSTGHLREIAEDVTGQQAALCDERRGRIDDRLTVLANATAENTRAIEELSKAVVTVVATVAQLATTDAAQTAALTAQAEKVAKHETKLAVMAFQLSIAALLGSGAIDLVRWLFQTFAQ